MREKKGCWVVGYGNRQRRDDGIGPYIVERLKDALQHRKEVHLLALPQLGTDLVEDLREAALLVFIDATTDNLEGGRKWRRLHPDIRKLPYLTHHIPPAFLLGLLKKFYGRTASAWLVSIHGRDFGFGEGFSRVAARTANRVSLEVFEFICKSN